VIGELYEHALAGWARPEIEHADGSRRPLPVEGWLHESPGDKSILDRCEGPTLDIGSGPGRLTVALSERGIPALGIDITPYAVGLARSSGALVLLRDVFDRVPGTGRWTTVLLADGIVKLAVVKMTGAIKEISIMRGHDPRAFALFAYGGAGPLHAAFIAAELGMSRVVVPPMPGNFSAFGLLVADVRHDEVRTRVTRTAELELAELQRLFGELTARARARLAEDGFAPAAMRLQASLDMRYVGQAFELAVPFDAGLATMKDVDRAFYTAHEARYAHATADSVEIVSLRVSAYGVGAKPSLPRATKDGSVPAARLAERAVLFDAVPTATAVYARDRLPAGAALEGPALIEEAGTTTVVPPGFRAGVDAHANLILERGAR